MEPSRLIGQAVYTDDHCGRYVGRLEDSAPLRDQLTVTGEHDCLGRIWRDVHRDLPATVVIKRLGDNLSRGWWVLHGRIPILETADSNGDSTATTGGNPQPGQQHAQETGGSCPGVWGGALRGPREMAKAGLPESAGC